MKGLFKYGAVASVFLLTAGSAAFAQNYTSSSGADWNQGGMRGTRSMQGYGGGMQGGAGWNQGGFSGSSQSTNTGPGQQDAYQELSRYGFNNIRNLQRSEGWEAHATKNGDRVHVFIDDDGTIATYRGE